MVPRRKSLWVILISPRLFVVCRFWGLSWSIAHFLTFDVIYLWLITWFLPLGGGPETVPVGRPFPPVVGRRTPSVRRPAVGRGAAGINALRSGGAPAAPIVGRISSVRTKSNKYLQFESSDFISRLITELFSSFSSYPRISANQIIYRKTTPFYMGTMLQVWWTDKLHVIVRRKLGADKMAREEANSSYSAAKNIKWST